MAYQISYGPAQHKQPQPQRGKWVLWTLLGLLALLLCARFFGWGSALADFLLPGDPQVTGEALENMVQQLEQGGHITDAVTAFCREIIENAAQ